MTDAHDPQRRAFDPSQEQGPPVIPGELVTDAPDLSAQPYQQPAPVQLYAPPQGGYGPPPGPTPVYMPPLKSVGGAFVLTFFFGVFGMFYSTVPGALIMLGIALGATVLGGLVVGVLSFLTLGVGALLFLLVPVLGVAIWVASIIWGCIAASSYNERLRAQFGTYSR